MNIILNDGHIEELLQTFIAIYFHRSSILSCFNTKNNKNAQKPTKEKHCKCHAISLYCSKSCHFILLCCKTRISCYHLERSRRVTHTEKEINILYHNSSEP